MNAKDQKQRRPIEYLKVMKIFGINKSKVKSARPNEDNISPKNK